MRGLGLLVVLVALPIGHAEEAKPEPENRLTLLGGYGPDGLNTKRTDNGLNVHIQNQPLWGLQYERRVFDQWSVAGQFMSGTSPQTTTYIGAVGVGYSW